MGITGIYKEIGPGQRIALSKLAVEKFEETGRSLRIAIDTSIWLFQIQASKGGTNPALRTFYYRLLRLISLSIHPVFVFDGPNKPPFKRNKRTGPNVASIPEFLAKQLLKQFGFPIHLAPGEAEAECALLQREGIVDAVLSEDVDTLMFGSGITIRNWSPEQKSNKTPTHVNVYDAVKTKSGPAGLDREGMILIALMSGGDYVPEGIPGIGIKTACEAARAGFGHDLCKIAKADRTAMRAWRERLKHELMTNESKLFSRKKPSLKMPEDFPRSDILGYYTHPALSSQAALDKLRRSTKWDQDLDFPGLRDFAHDAFDWVRLEGAKHFVRSLAPSLLVRHLRMRGEQNDICPSNDIQAIEKDEALLVKGLHGKRQHPVTDNTAELRVSFVPIQLVKIDLSIEDPDEELDSGPLGPQVQDDEDEEELPLEIDDDEGPKKRGPTKFDPTKPARAWVLETFVKVGVPLKVQDWEAGRQQPVKAKRAASANDAAKSATKPRGARRAKPANYTSQATIERFAKITKPGAKLSQALQKAQSQASDPRAPLKPPHQLSKTMVDLLSSSPAKPASTATQEAKEKSFATILDDLPSSVTKRRRRAPIQRSHTLPSDSSTTPRRPNTPPLDAIDLLESPLPSLLPAKKARVRVTNNDPTARPARGTSIDRSPGKIKQTTLDAWRSPTALPTKSRKEATSAPTVPIPAPPRFQRSRDEAEIETLDLTLPSPTRPIPPPSKTAVPINLRRTVADVFTARPPLESISSNTSFSPDSSTSRLPQPTPSNSKSTSDHQPPASTRCPSPRLRRTRSLSPEIETLDLTQLSPPRPTLLQRPSQPQRPAATEIEVAKPSSPKQVARSPSPPAAWKTQAKKKRKVILRKSLAGAWAFADAESPAKTSGGVEVGLKGKERWKGRESEIEVLDMT